MNIQTKYPNQIIQAVGQAVAGLYGGELLCYMSNVKESDVATHDAYCE